MKTTTNGRKKSNTSLFILTGLLCLFMGTSISAQNTSDAVYDPAPNSTAKFYKELAGTTPSNTFNLGDAIYVQFLFTEKIAGQIQTDEQVRATVYNNGNPIAYQKFKNDDELLGIYFSETYSFDLNVMANSGAFTTIKGLTEATLTDRKMSCFIYFAEGLWGKMMIAGMAKLGEGTHTVKVAFETGKEEFDNSLQKNVFKVRKTFSAGEFTLKTTNTQIDAYRNDMITVFGEVKARGFKTTTDNGIKTDVHKQNLGKIVFSNAPIKEETASSAFKTSFSSLSECIYGRVFLPKSLHNIMANCGTADNTTNFALAFYLDGKYINSSSNSISQDQSSKVTSYEIALAPKEGVDYIGLDTEYGYKINEMVKGFAETLKKATAGKHTFKVIMYVPYLNPYDLSINEEQQVAVGEFDLNVIEAERKAFIDKNEQKYGETQHKSYKAGCANLYIKNSTGGEISYNINGMKGTISYGVTMDFKDIPLGTTYTINGSTRVVTTASDGITTVIN